MNLRSLNLNGESNPLWSAAHRRSGSVLIIVMWIAFGVVSLALYFAHSTEMDIRAADNQLASEQADAGIESGMLYASNVLANVMQLSMGGNMQANMQPYMLPQTNYYKSAGVKVGESMFWFIGRDTNDNLMSHRSPDPVFCLVDEASKANLNNTNVFCSPDSTTKTNLLQNLPRMNFQVLSCMYDWSNTNTTPSSEGAKSSVYGGLNPPYDCKLTNYDTVGELRMVYQMNLDLLYGEDINLNGALDPNENDGQRTSPNDNSDGKLDPGFMEYLTVYTHEPTNLSGNPTNNGGANRILVNSTGLTTFIQTNFPTVYSDISSKLRGLTGMKSPLEFALKSGITEQDFITIEPWLLPSTNIGLININTASQVALSLIPGIGSDGVIGVGSAQAQTILNYRQSNPTRLNSVFWMLTALSSIGTGAQLTNLVTTVGPWITSHSWQYSADIAAVGHYGRGYRRVRFVFDCSSGVPLVVYRQDLTYLGWALGKKTHDQLLAGTLR